MVDKPTEAVTEYSDRFDLINMAVQDDDQYSGEAVHLYYIPVSQAVLWDKNPKLHNLDAIVQSIEQNGFRDPPTWDSQLQGLVEGNGRTTALQLMEKQGRKPPRGILKHQTDGYWCMPVLFGIDAESQSQAIRYAIDHNNLTLTGGDFTPTDMARMWNKEQYLSVLSDIDDDLLPVSLIGFDLTTLEDQGEGQREEEGADDNREDVIGELQKKWGVKLGDIWVIKTARGRGEHRIICGSSLLPETIAALMKSDKAQGVITDPPYGISFKRGETIVDPGRKSKRIVPDSIQNDSFELDDQREFIRTMFLNLQAYCEMGTAVYMFAASMREGHFSYFGMMDAAIHVQSHLVWNKSNFVIGQNDYHWKHESVWYGWWEGAAHKWYGGRDKHTIIDAPIVTKTDHPNQKPVEIIEIFLNNSTLPGNIVLEPFSGSGSTMVGCEQQGRLCRAIELEPGFVALALERMERLGLTPVRETEGEPVEERV